LLIKSRSFVDFEDDRAYYMALIIIFIQLQLGWNPVAEVYTLYSKREVVLSLECTSGGLHERHVVATWSRGTIPAFA
jgi:hypothetical protein